MNKGSECGSTESKPTNCSISGTVNHLDGDMFWHLTKLEIQDWVDFKEIKFAREETKRSLLSSTEWLERYLYRDIHEIFFNEFLSVLY